MSACDAGPGIAPVLVFAASVAPVSVEAAFDDENLVSDPRTNTGNAAMEENP